MNMNQKARDEIVYLLKSAVAAAAEKNLLPAAEDVAFTVEVPREAAHGDFSANYAMAAARAMLCDSVWHYLTGPEGQATLDAIRRTNDLIHH